MRPGNRAEALLELPPLTGRDTLAAARSRDGLSPGVPDGGDQFAHAGSAVVIAHPGSQLDGRPLLTDFGRGDERAAIVFGRSLERHMQPVADYQAHVAIDASVDIEIPGRHRRNPES